MSQAMSSCGNMPPMRHQQMLQPIYYSVPAAAKAAGQSAATHLEGGIGQVVAARQAKVLQLAPPASGLAGDHSIRHPAAGVRQVQGVPQMGQLLHRCPPRAVDAGRCSRWGRGRAGVADVPVRTECVFSVMEHTARLQGTR